MVGVFVSLPKLPFLNVPRYVDIIWCLSGKFYVGPMKPHLIEWMEASIPSHSRINLTKISEVD